jgi:hypothetical protein
MNKKKKTKLNSNSLYTYIFLFILFERVNCWVYGEHDRHKEIIFYDSNIFNRLLGFRFAIRLGFRRDLMGPTH